MHRHRATLHPYSLPYTLTAKEGNSMRDFEKLVAEGANKNRSHGLRYDLNISELKDLLESVTPDWSRHLSLAAPVMKALSRAYVAGIEAGYRMAQSDQKQRKL